MKRIIGYEGRNPVAIVPVERSNATTSTNATGGVRWMQYREVRRVLRVGSVTIPVGRWEAR